MRNLILLLMVCLFAVGCGYRAEMLKGPMDITGKVTKGGQPFGNVVLMLQPLEAGHPAPLEVKADGSFKGSLVPGKYAYYLAPSNDPAQAAAFQGVDAAMKEANMERTVTVKDGQSQLDVAL